MIYPPNSSGGSGGGVGCSRNRGPNPRPGPKIRGGGSARNGGGKNKQHQQVVQWKQRNVQEGVILVDEAQLSKLIKREPIHKYYDMDPEPFANKYTPSSQQHEYAHVANIKLCGKLSVDSTGAAILHRHVGEDEDTMTTCRSTPDKGIHVSPIFVTSATTQLSRCLIGAFKSPRATKPAIKATLKDTVT
uniref:Uncharacterized protein n=1 Tax=Timema cristinae TaxID=61476 RepID=A0A7R9CHU0_TIMCR|nr:unnamed protein product [Timema cristinae]